MGQQQRSWDIKNEVGKRIFFFRKPHQVRRHCERRNFVVPSIRGWEMLRSLWKHKFRTESPPCFNTRCLPSGGIASLGETMWHESFMRFNHTQKVSFTIVFLAYFVSKGRRKENLFGFCAHREWNFIKFFLQLSCQQLESPQKSFPLVLPLWGFVMGKMSKYNKIIIMQKEPDEKCMMYGSGNVLGIWKA